MEDKYKLPSQEQFGTLNDTLAQLAHNVAMANGINDASTWAEVQSITKKGLASSYFSVGDQLVTKFNDGNTNYDFPLDVVHTADVELADGTTKHGLFLQSHYALPFATQFSGYRAFLACPSGLNPGTYHVTFGADWTNAKKGAVYQFTLTKQVEKDGRLGGFHQMPDVDPSTWKVYSYAADGKTLVETVDVISGNAGTDLGTMNLNTRNENLNSMQECAYGHNRWKDSALRQYLNSDQQANYWWSPVDKWDIAPDYLATKNGFLYNFDHDLVARLQPTKIVTYPNTQTDDTTGNTADVTYDKVFLPSLGQAFCANDKNEGDAWAYYKQLKGDGTPAKQWSYDCKPYVKYLLNDHKSARYVFLRSANRGDCVNVWLVGADGCVRTWTAINSSACAPALIIG